MNALQSWLKTLLKYTFYISLLCLLAAWSDDYVIACLVVALVMLLVNYYQLYSLNIWLRDSKKRSHPQVHGAWGYLYDNIYQAHRRQRKKRKKLSKLVERYRNRAEAFPDAVIVIDKDLSIMWCNRLARLELGVVWPDNLGMPLVDLLPFTQFVQYINKGDFTYPIELPAPVNPNKTNEYRVIPYGDDNLLLISRDVTHVAQLEGMRRDFVANVSHEMRTPLTVINGYLELLPDTAFAADALAQKALYEMNTQTQRMQNLIEDLLVLSRIQSSSESIYDHIVDMPRMLDVIRMEALHLNCDKQHQIQFHIEPDLFVYGVETELRSVCSNLIFNALHYTPEQGVIDVYWTQQDGRARFVVTDNGQGIEPDDIDRLTERFYRVDKARSRKTGGSGLGLSIVKHALNHHNAALHIHSVVGEGSEFSFTLGPEFISSSEAQTEC